jgi:hypothetical protein
MAVPQHNEMEGYGSTMIYEPTTAKNTVDTQPQTYDSTARKRYTECTRTTWSTETMTLKNTARNNGSEGQLLAGSSPKIGIWSQSFCDITLHPRSSG